MHRRLPWSGGETAIVPCAGTPAQPTPGYVLCRTRAARPFSL
ncbi:hypothetical protein [Lysobacter gummosus]